MAHADCSVDKVNKQTLPCSKNQAAAVYCYTNTIEIVYNIHQKYDEKKFSVDFGMRYIKTGQYFDVLGSPALDGSPKQKYFEAYACEQSVKLTRGKSEKMNCRLKGIF